ncbi:ribosome maturation factor RimM [Microbulbifer thermotolerans]|uniref:Ribosome maturation factor RimM n=1 Tax=Microbulbifer thermotolerans TaxID=252514 RepID=A0A143HQT3_MICTH|nr:ribosome maturation factor RimM [Microbulbifer thermotolerans]AMX04093.1 ribosome maturation factor RimM [Microbulbifer thermotolerans]MCX2778789.1 ribosome maturation factor RimM [Microbulbifer thermotolerans]MCX2781939.1 ribosome maturation factor RimM [Microbulbifer thermotolerans]MCX2793675.1 ribosome maturation factor RimM [Microbulbifer thermotolerans]MCX2800859.1 ribosome maturation factor RimM [Microbulbifer thermotolerans]
MADSGSHSEDLVTVGRITAVYGVRGWVKVHSYTEPMDNILQFEQWWLRKPHGWEKVEVDRGKRHGKGLIVHIKGVDDRDLAGQFCQRDIAVGRNLMPPLEEGEYYWHQLEGLRVVSRFNGGDYDLGTVVRLMETGANDVLVVRGQDKRERLIPYLPGDYISDIDLASGVITVDWDPEF